ncbi:Peroxisomal nicotinamide adenine dinucleotide carrier isoform D [Glycine soja]|uniref:Peroxisomal nicotinamide adenine dinucleotide carrier isoform D n=2 Tax=Glycine soja TaxID=3848 RepID=A0A445EZ17_GLYSO|nr:Peroxisomal nicotinamide adenine dinucleotide carrier isoform D [Glycine soja]
MNIDNLNRKSAKMKTNLTLDVNFEWLKQTNSNVIVQHEDGTREDPQNQTIINGSLWVNLENSSCSASENNKTPEPPKEQPVFNCPICMSALEEETSTRCAHIFCKNCIRAALSAQAKCPTCRKVTRNSLIRVFLPATS